LSWSHRRLFRTSWQYLGAIVWFARTIPWLNWPSFGLRRTVYRSGACNAWLCCDGARGSDHGRTALVHVVELLAVLRSFALVLDLRRHGWSARTAEGCNLGWLWSHSEAAPPSVVGDAGVVHDDRAVVDVGDVDDVNAIDCAVVIKVVSIPIATVVAVTGIAEAIVNAAIEPDVQAPVATAKAPAILVPTPVARRPEGTVVRRSAPGARNPVVACGSPVPIARCPQVVGCGSLGLLVFGERWRRLIGVLHGSGLTVRIELLCSLGILISLVLIRQR